MEKFKNGADNMKMRWLTLLMLAFAGISAAMADELSTGQTLYLPVYSKIWHGDRIEGQHPVDRLVSALVSVRNTSLKTPIKIISARYYNTDGKLLKEYLDKPVVVNAMGTLELFVERKESDGGSGANFILQWDSAVPTNPPVVEAIHADIRTGQQAFVFITTAHPIQADK